VQPAQRPADVLGRGITGDAEAGDLLRRGQIAVEAARGIAGDVEEPAVVDLQGAEQAEDSARPQLGEVGQGRPEVRRADRCQA
jgi:hypothetical protein